VLEPALSVSVYVDAEWQNRQKEGVPVRA
jgi:hypothetical protein